MWGEGSSREEVWCSSGWSTHSHLVLRSTHPRWYGGGGWGSRKRPGQIRKPTGLARTETPAVLSSLIFLICPFWFLLFSPSYNTMVLAHHGAPPSAEFSLQVPFATIPHTHLATPLHISQRGPLPLAIPGDRPAAHTGQLPSVPRVSGPGRGGGGGGDVSISFSLPSVAVGSPRASSPFAPHL